MTDLAIRVENLGKQYRLGLTHDRTLRDLAQRWTRRLLRGPTTNNGRLTTEHQTLASNNRPLTPDRCTPTPDQAEFWALKDVSFEVKRGEVLGVIGRNGAGKSTLLKILSQITKPTTGRAEIHGRVGSLREVGTGLHPELTGREDVYLNRFGMTKREFDGELDETIDFAGLLTCAKITVVR